MSVFVSYTCACSFCRSLHEVPRIINMEATLADLNICSGGTLYVAAATDIERKLRTPVI